MFTYKRPTTIGSHLTDYKNYSAQKCCDCRHWFIWAMWSLCTVWKFW